MMGWPYDSASRAWLEQLRRCAGSRIRPGWSLESLMSAQAGRGGAPQAGPGSCCKRLSPGWCVPSHCAAAPAVCRLGSGPIPACTVRLSKPFWFGDESEPRQEKGRHFPPPQGWGCVHAGNGALCDLALAPATLGAGLPQEGQGLMHPRYAARASGAFSAPGLLLCAQQPLEIPGLGSESWAKGVGSALPSGRSSPGQASDTDQLRPERAVSGHGSAGFRPSCHQERRGCRCPSSH